MDDATLAKYRVAEIAKEFTEGFKFLADYPKSVTFFGSNQTKESDPYYQSARSLSARLVKEFGYSVVSGGGPGIMEAADRGAYEAGGNSIGLLIRLPNEQPVNPYITKSISFYYFFARKVCLSFGAEVFIFYPGGFGTLDEFFELITLIQTKKIKNVPLICVGSEYWNKVRDFMREEMLARKAIEPEHLDLFTITDSHDEIVNIIKKTPVRSSIPFSGPVSGVDQQIPA
ncbi:MAG: Rossman fold protein, TIGR00730 family [Candidatus Zambryskibacteria bacterium RIFCSPLOWO2_02_FULL_51_21]|uniref:Cytokinin riboside 5'-monophosphate phosphoribohydrolase n=1 Tax=Candidatus Zambryskibacteria bacterium RIFCSPHIGHO2_02_FULL_43_37 TaxID=1802749 RepID=A0A1G2TJQ5_9BACT|nr:MAG: Rossman fold protein, TIGR00730 family [Candidatus Zambryskibacteria bacterium RIFCSPHIGHO2_01_FULL_52_18]OHA96919.1 MAG: Rossman fold protein, TIGR00730 family [Candidatus Zambryskibacteria bacterium RIFCSPHIGHO2_02_FULL_43_37]OHB06700.1 MAG: Rossman fold protein, TIGR00730 family [Candidatus Zambryskibacteria bacterium RIFCSPLOWO2_01_FULL_52_12]OHB11032.1 MAG: Rossman fold protein, TIGR00730 family [Candidatus Zambryskibacteria bacterium RIFCSPLOWO2_02_FULL_51_21]